MRAWSGQSCLCGQGHRWGCIQCCMNVTTPGCELPELYEHALSIAHNYQTFRRSPPPLDATAISAPTDAFTSPVHSANT
jgi:hypothetical protein